MFQLKAIWGEYETESDALRAILVVERDRQRSKLQVEVYSCCGLPPVVTLPCGDQDRLEKLKVERIKYKVEQVQKALENRRQRDVGRLQAVEGQFKAVMTVREACLKAARARVQNKPPATDAGT
jgi:hypothetical protein